MGLNFRKSCKNPKAVDYCYISSCAYIPVPANRVAASYNDYIFDRVVAVTVRFRFKIHASHRFPGFRRPVLLTNKSTNSFLTLANYCITDSNGSVIRTCSSNSSLSLRCTFCPLVQTISSHCFGPVLVVLDRSCAVHTAQLPYLRRSV